MIAQFMGACELFMLSETVKHIRSKQEDKVQAEKEKVSWCEGLCMNDSELSF